MAVLLGIAIFRIGNIARRFGRYRTTQLVAPALFVVLLFGGIVDGWPSRRQFEADQTLVCWSTVAKALRPVFLPADRMSPEALGIFSSTLPDTYVHDYLGLTDGYVAQHATKISPTYGKSNPAYTYETIHPTVFVFHSRGWLTAMARASAGRYNEDYDTFFLDHVPSCSDRTMIVSVRNDAESRILPQLAQYAPRQVIVPS